MPSRPMTASTEDGPAPALAYFRHLEYPNVLVKLPGVGSAQFVSHFYTTSDPAEIAALRARGGAIVEDDGTPEYRCPVEGCAFVTTKPGVLAGHRRTAHQGD